MRESIQSCKAFLDWLVTTKGYRLAKSHEHTEECEANGCGLSEYRERTNIENLLYGFSVIDKELHEKEKAEILLKPKESKSLWQPFRKLKRILLFRCI